VDLYWGALAAVFNLNNPGHYIQWGWFQISVANLIVIILMIVTFVVALFLPFPGRNRRRGDDK
jgi:hypothetical protein